MLYIPGNNPAMLQQAGVYGADSVLLDLEDAVALNQKDAARILVRNMLETNDFYNCEITIRLNHIETPFGLSDLEEIISSRSLYTNNSYKNASTYDEFDNNKVQVQCVCVATSLCF